MVYLKNSALRDSISLNGSVVPDRKMSSASVSNRKNTSFVSGITPRSARRLPTSSMHSLSLNRMWSR